MNIATILDLVAGTVPDRTAVCDDTHRFTYLEIDALSNTIAASIRRGGFERVSWLASNSAAFPAVIFACARAGVPFVPLNYRLADDMLLAQAQRLGHSLLIVDSGNAGRLDTVESLTIRSRDDLLAEALDSVTETPGHDGDTSEPDTSEDAYWLFTSGTTGPPKISVLAHGNLSSYILGTVEMCAADEDDAILISVPPYHIAGLASVLSSFFAARRMVYLTNFDPSEWVSVAARERITQAMVVPTMLQRVLDALPSDTADTALPSLRSLSYGGGRMPVDVLTDALRTLPHVDFANAYGLTETSSTIALMGPDDIREAFTSTDPKVSRRLASVGKPVPGIELQIRTESGDIAGPAETGEIWVRGPQVSGRYLGQAERESDDWFCTRDQGEIDEDGFLFLHGRVDDVIVRGGENISPGEIEDVLRTHPAVRDVVVVADTDQQWGEVPVAVIIENPSTATTDDDLKAHVRAVLRSSRVPERIVRVTELPYNELGKIQRFKVKQELLESIVHEGA